MANITKRYNKDGSLSFLIRVFMEETPGGKQTVKSMTWRPPSKMKLSVAEKQVNREAAMFEERVRQRVVTVSGTTTFAEYAKVWMKNNSQLAFKTRERYEGLLKRIIPAIGSIKLEKLQAQHLEAFYRSLSEKGVKEKGRYATSDTLDAEMKKRGLSREALGSQAGIASSTVSAAARGKRVSIEKAEEISEVLGLNVKKLFTIVTETEGLSPKSIHHHHELISTILGKAKREQIIPYNVAQEHAQAPKLPRNEAKYLDDEQAQHFLALLFRETDIRVKTLLIILLFTGVRRGELCGLSWQDCDLQKNVIHIRRASQYQSGNGIVEVQTKNKTSYRHIGIPAIVVECLVEYKQWWDEESALVGVDWRGEEDRLFIRDNGAPINPDTVNYWFDKFLLKNNLPHITPHSLRHTFATLQITAGVDMRTLQARTGHSQASTLVNTYSHAIQSAQDKATELLENVLMPRPKNEQ